jgi:hypothetical protein
MADRDWGAEEEFVSLLHTKVKGQPMISTKMESIIIEKMRYLTNSKERLMLCLTWWLERTPESRAIRYLEATRLIS